MPVPPGVSPAIPQQRVGEYICVYTAVCPRDGENFSLILPWSNTEMMNMFPDEFSKQYQDCRIITVTDRAPRHPSENSNKFDKIRAIRQPRHSPEANPAGHIREHIRENYFHNSQFKTSDISEYESVNALYELGQNKNTVKSVTGFHRIIRLCSYLL